MIRIRSGRKDIKNRSVSSDSLTLKVVLAIILEYQTHAPGTWQIAHLGLCDSPRLCRRQNSASGPPFSSQS